MYVPTQDESHSGCQQGEKTSLCNPPSDKTTQKTEYACTTTYIVTYHYISVFHKMILQQEYNNILANLLNLNSS